MRVLLCHPGTQHAGKLAALLRQEDLLGGYFTGFRPKPGSVLARFFRLSGLRKLDDSLSGFTTQIRAPEIFGKVAQTLGWGGERMIRLRNAWFQKRIPDRAIASSDAVIGFDTASWILAHRARKLGRPFILDRAAVHRSTRASIQAALNPSASGMQSSISKPGDVQTALESEEITLAAKVVVASRFAERSLLDAGVAAEKIVTIPYGVASDWFGKGDGHGDTGGKTVFLFVGNVTVEKGLRVLLEAWRRMDADPRHAELCLAGGGSPEVLEMAGSTPGVRVLGKLGPEDLRDAYRNATVFVFPTFFDGFGMVLLEAMASGIPVIATPNCAAPELLRDGTAGLIFPAGDAAALCSAMRDVCTNRSAWAKRGAAAREIAGSYSWETYGARWAALLREVVA